MNTRHLLKLTNFYLALCLRPLAFYLLPFAFCFSARAQSPGSLDTTFLPGLSAGPVHSIAVLPDGRIYIGGNFTTVGGVTRFWLARLNPDGSLDPTFKTSDSNSGIQIAVAQPDGKLLVGGTFTLFNGLYRRSVVRLNPDGSNDDTFHSPFAQDGASVTRLVLTPSGQIYVAGSQLTLTNSFFRLNGDGSIDPAFVPRGYSLYPRLDAIVPLPNGQLIIGAGQFFVGGQTKPLAIRLNADGSADSSFTVTAPGGYSLPGEALALVRQPNDQLLVGGTGSANYLGRSLARLNADGSADLTFGPNLAVISQQDWRISQMAAQPDGKIVCVGTFTDVFGAGRTNVGRLNADGSVDPGLLLSPGPNYYCDSVALQADGRILIGGAFSFFGSVTNRGLARLYGDASPPLILQQPASQTNWLGAPATLSVNWGGTPTPSFEWRRDGTPLGAPSEPALTWPALGQDDQGDYTVVLHNESGTVTSAVARVEVLSGAPQFVHQPQDITVYVYWPHPEPPVTISADVIGGPPPTYQWFFNGSPLPNETNATLTVWPCHGCLESLTFPVFHHYSVLASNAFDAVMSRDVTVTRVGPIECDDHFWTTENRLFTWDGQVVLNYYLNGVWPEMKTVRAFGVQPDGHILVGGFFPHGIHVLALRRNETNSYPCYGCSSDPIPWATDGNLDPDFQPGTGASSTVTAIVPLSGGQWLVGGYFSSYNSAATGPLVRLNADGSPDNSLPTHLSGGHVTALVKQSDGKILMCGSWTTLNGTNTSTLVRLNADGSLDTGFNQIASSAAVTALATQSDGRILIGHTTTGHTISDGVVVRPEGIVRLSNNGFIDPSFEADGPVGPGLSSQVNAIAVQPDGRILIGGVFTLVGDQARTNLARLLPNGRIDPVFNPNVGPDGDVQAVAVLNGGAIVVGGLFHHWDLVHDWGVAVLKPDGTVDRSAYLAIDFSGGGQVYAAQTQPDGSVLVGGNFENLTTRPSFPAADVAATNRDGTLEVFSSFGVNPITHQSGIMRFRLDGTYASAPQILVQPQSQVLFGNSLSLSVVASGSSPLFYTWLRSGTNLGFPSTAVLTANNVSPAWNGNYSVIVSNLYGSVTSEVAQITVKHVGPVTNIINFDPQTGFNATWQFTDGQSFTPSDLASFGLLRSTNLHDWTTPPGLFQLLNGRIVLTDPQSLTAPRSFYRFILSP